MGPEAFQVTRIVAHMLLLKAFVNVQISSFAEHLVLCCSNHMCKYTLVLICILSLLELRLKGTQVRSEGNACFYVGAVLLS